MGRSIRFERLQELSLGSLVCAKEDFVAFLSAHILSLESLSLSANAVFTNGTRGEDVITALSTSYRLPPIVLEPREEGSEQISDESDESDDSSSF